MKAKRFFMMMFAAVVMILTGCNKYDDIEGRVDTLEERIITLEEATAALKTRLDAGYLIKSVTPLEDESGWRIEFTGGTPSYIDVLNGGTGSNPSLNTTQFDVRDSETGNGTLTLWVNYGDGWEDTGAVISDEESITDPTPGPEGPQGVPGPEGDPGVTPLLEVRTVDDVTTIWYNVTHTDGVGGEWIDTECDISATGPVLTILHNDNGTATIVMNDADPDAVPEPIPATTFTFREVDPEAAIVIAPVRIEVRTTGVVGMTENATAQVVFVVNPSDAVVDTADMSLWEIDMVETRTGYVVADNVFSVQSITASSGGRYTATVKAGNYGSEANDEHSVALVYNAGTADKPSLISSGMFVLRVNKTPYTITITDQPDNINVTEWIIPANTSLSVTAEIPDGVLSYQWYSNTTASNVGGTEISGATGTSYTIPTNTVAGTYYYFVEVKATGGAAPVRSEAATVTVTADQLHQDQGVVINGITWATRNVGASGTFVTAPTDYGNLYDFDAAQTVCPPGWRLPTTTEFESLADATSVWADGPPNGREFGPTNGQKIFMPAAGYDGALGHVWKDSTGAYWSSTTKTTTILFVPTTDYFNLEFDWSDVESDGTSGRDTKLSVRCVKQ